MRATRLERHRELRRLLQQEPLLTDEELARRLQVSVPTIRLDRLTLGIPEVRQRAEGLARRAMSGVRALDEQEVVGELVDLELGVRATSVLETRPSMSFARTGIVRSHYLFAQADSLALAVIDGALVLTGRARSKFRRGARLVATASVVRRRHNRYVVEVTTRVGEDAVFHGTFLVVALPGEEATGRAHRG
jgi:acyl-coenzyme A thioesterase PaaI-like protein